MRLSQRAQRPVAELFSRTIPTSSDCMLLEFPTPASYNRRQLKQIGLWLRPLEEMRQPGMNPQAASNDSRLSEPCEHDLTWTRPQSAHSTNTWFP